MAPQKSFRISEILDPGTRSSSSHAETTTGSSFANGASCIARRYSASQPCSKYPSPTTIIQRSRTVFPIDTFESPKGIWIIARRCTASINFMNAPTGRFLWRFTRKVRNNARGTDKYSFALSLADESRLRIELPILCKSNELVVTTRLYGDRILANDRTVG